MKPTLLLLGILLLGVTPCLVAAQSGPANADPHQQLQQILRRPMFQAWKDRQQGANLPDIHAPDGVREWLRRLFQPLRDFLKWLFSPGRPRAVSGSSSFEFLPTALKIAGWTVLAVALGFLGFLLFKRMSASTIAGTAAQILSRQSVHEAMEAGDALALGTAEWMDEARRLAAERNFRAVYRALYLALLSGLHTAGKIEHSRNRTNWAYVNQYRGPVEERRTFGELTDLFDRVWYGRKETEGTDLELLKRQIDALTGGGGA